MSETISDSKTAALKAGVAATIEHLRRSFMYDFNLKHPRLAYMAGCNLYLNMMIQDNMQNRIDRSDFETTLRSSVILKLGDEDCAVTIKLTFLLLGLTIDATLYERFWGQQYESRDLQTTKNPAVAGSLAVESSVFETRSALTRYRAKLRSLRSCLVQEVNVCIKRYNEGLVAGRIAVTIDDEVEVGVDERAWATEEDECEEDDGGEEGVEDEEANKENVDPAVAAANANDDSCKAAWGRIIEVGDTWERRENGDWFCSECFGKVYSSWGSMKRHLMIKHRLLV